ncbi:MAG TPA: WD40 repeat domain-containing protein, partial [Anaerolineae bacterium]|nr:WD40 repeat domain-containing protein [Anaerolineae bacterium]
AINAQISAEFDRATAEAASTVAIEQQATAEAERAEAERQTNIALSRQLAAESLNVLGTDPERAIQLAMEAIRASKTREEAVIPEAINALHRAVQSSRVQTVIKAYDTIVFDVSYSLDGKYLASGGFDGNVYIWDLETANPPLALSRDSISLTGAKINQDGTLIFLSDIKGNVEVWDLATKQLLPGYPKSLHKEAAIIDVDLTQDDSLLATTGSDSTTRITDATTGEIIQQIPLDGIGCGVAFNADGSQVVTGDINGSIYLWDLEKEQEIRQFTHASEHQEACAVALSPDNQLLATGGADMTTKLWSQETGELLSTLAQHTDTIFRITFSPDGKLLASAGFDNKANVYDVVSGKLLQTLAGHKGRLRAVAFAPDGSQLVSADEAGEIRFWDVSFG